MMKNFPQHLNGGMMNTILLVTAAFSYSVGGYFMKLSDGLTKGGPTTLVFGLFCLGALLQTIAMRYAEMSVSYIVVLGLEAITAFVLGMFLLGETVTVLKVLGVMLVAVGIVVLRS
jgi:multidrug transporter EmrE-like cation transporter